MKVTNYLDSLEGEAEMVFVPPYAPDLNPNEQCAIRWEISSHQKSHSSKENH